MLGFYVIVNIPGRIPTKIISSCTIPVFITKNNPKKTVATVRVGYSRNSRKFLLLTFPSGRTKFIGNSMKFKALKVGNALPKSYSLTLSALKQMLFQHLVSTRKELFVKLLSELSPHFHFLFFLC